MFDWHVCFDCGVQFTCEGWDTPVPRGPGCAKIFFAAISPKHVAAISPKHVAALTEPKRASLPMEKHMSSEQFETIAVSLIVFTIFIIGGFIGFLIGKAFYT